MSVRIMSAVWERQDITPTQKLVLLAFADWANDEGLCWPSIERVCVKSSLTRRTVQVAIRDLSEMGLLVQEKSTGRSCKYWITLGAQEMHPCSSSAPEAQEKRPRGAGNAPNTLYTHQLTTKGIIGMPDWLPIDAWEGWLAMRKKLKKPPTDRAMQMAIKKLEDLAQQGNDPAAVLDQSTLSGWTDLYPIKKDTKKDGKRNRNSQSDDGLSSTARAALSVFGDDGEGHEYIPSQQVRISQPTNGLLSSDGSKWDDGGSPF
jgi:DNA-binding MarR family transcriptional regulator